MATHSSILAWIEEPGGLYSPWGHTELDMTEATLQQQQQQQRVKRLPAMRETRVRSLGREDTLEEEMASHASTLA